jgi:hypothetical protein
MNYLALFSFQIDVDNYWAIRVDIRTAHKHATIGCPRRRRQTLYLYKIVSKVCLCKHTNNTRFGRLVVMQ